MSGDGEKTRPMTVGAIRAALADLPDDAQAFVGVSGLLPDYPITEVWVSQQIAWDDEDWKPGDPLVTGAEFYCYADFDAIHDHETIAVAALIATGRHTETTARWALLNGRVALRKSRTPAPEDCGPTPPEPTS